MRALTSGPFEDMFYLIGFAIGRKQEDLFHDLEIALRRHKPDFIALLQNPAMNSSHRDQVKKSTEEGLQLPGEARRHKLPAQFVEEALLLSELVKLNEFSAVELLLQGEEHQPRHPGLSRGLVAVLLYHEERKCLVSCLRSLIQAREGTSWTLGLSDEMNQLITNFTDDLLQSGLTEKILSLLASLHVETELSALEKGRGVGGVKHRQQIISLVTEQRIILADCLFCWTCQNPLPKADLFAVLKFLKELTRDQLLVEDGTVNPVYLSLLMTVLYSLNAEPPSDVDIDSTDEFYDSLPMFHDKKWIGEFHEKLLGDGSFRCKEMTAVIMLAWSLVVNIAGKRSNMTTVIDALQEDDEQLFDQAIAGGALKFLRHAIVLSPVFSEEEYYIRRIHGIVTGILVNMPFKVKKLRNENDEVVRIITLHIQQGAEPPEGLRHDFEDLMRLIGEIYMNDGLKLQLEVEYWGPSEPSLGSMGTNTPVVYQHQTSQRQVSLYKFVRLAGDLLPSSLFTPYLDMLFGLSNSPVAAHHCYNMLKANSASLGAGTASSNVSWDHFFLTMKQYYLIMKQDAALTDGAPIHSLVPGVIATDELEGLHAVLRLLRQIVKQDQPAGIALYESQYWLPIPTLVQLVGCPVPLQLKANLLLCLAAFALIPDIANNLWHMMESQQFLQTVPPQQGQQQTGIKVELEDIESCAEEYPETRAFMSLLDSLTNSPIPPTLGAGYRVPGFDPYLEFLRDSVLLKFDTRAYHNAEEKWLVGASVLELLHKLLSHYNPEPSHFAETVVDVQGSIPPGHTIMVHLLNESPFLGKILSVIDAGAQYAVEPVKMSHSGQNAFERSVLLALRIVDVMLTKQSAFFEHLRAQNSSILATLIEQLLLAINPRTGRPDHFVNIAWLVCDHGMSADLCLTAVKILCSVCKLAAIQKDIVRMWTLSEDISTDILHGFVTQLENSDPEHLSPPEEDTQDDEVSDVTVSQISSSIRLHIVHLMQISLNHSAPNVAHFLLGFELTRPVSQTSLQDPGVRGSPRTCLHAILDVLSEHITVQRLASSSAAHKPQLAEVCYSLIYSLCSNASTSQPTVRYLRTSHDFFYRHLESLPFPMLQSSEMESEGSELDTQLLCSINQQAWLLKSVALELRLTAMNRQHFHTQRLITSLLSEETVPFVSDSDQHLGLDVALQSRSRMTGQGQNRLLRVLSVVNLNQGYPPKFELQFFDTAVVENLVASLESSPLSGASGEVGLCDIRSLNRVLIDELNSAQGIPIAQRGRILEEIHSILQVAMQRNGILQAVNAKRQLLNGWRQVVEVLLIACPVDLLDANVRRSVVVEVIQELLLKVSSDGTSPQLAAPLHGILMTLVAQLKRTVQISPIPAGTLHSILRGLIEQLMRSSSGQQQRVRSHIYSALLYYLQATSSGKESPSLTDFVFGMGGGAHGHDALESGNLAVLSHYGDSVMEVVCRDACDGSDIIRMLAFAVLDCIVVFDWQYKWLNYLAAKGYLRHCINSLVHEDASLQATLARNPEPLKALYIYESKMAFLTRLAQFSAGAQALLHSGLFARLSECGFLDMRPEASTYVGIGSHTLSGDSLLDEGYAGMFQDSFAPAVIERYHQLLFPALRLVQTVLNSLGKQQRDASLQALGFVSSHSEVIFGILKERSRALTLAGLEEVSLVTGLVCRACVGLGDWVSGIGLRSLGTSNAELHASLTRIQRLMLSLLTHYCLPDAWDKLIKNIISAEVQVDPDSSALSLSPDGVMEAAMPLLQQITLNVVTHCRHVMTGGNYSHRSRLINIMLEPTLVEQTQTSGFEGMASVSRPPSMGILIHLLEGCCDGYLAASDAYQRYQRKLSNMLELSSDELKEYAEWLTVSEKMTAQQREELASHRLNSLVEAKQREMGSFLYIIETALYVLWCHLEFFFVQCVPKPVDDQLGLDMSTPTMRRLQEPQWMARQSTQRATTSGFTEGVSRADIEQLKAEAISFFTDAFFKNLLDVERSREQKGFVDALTRRIKRLLKLRI